MIIALNGLTASNMGLLTKLLKELEGPLGTAVAKVIARENGLPEEEFDEANSPHLASRRHPIPIKMIEALDVIDRTITQVTNLLNGHLVDIRSLNSNLYRCMVPAAFEYKALWDLMLELVELNLASQPQ